LLDLAAFCTVVHPAAVAEILDELEDDQIWPILDQADLPLRVEIFEYMSLRRQMTLVEQLDPAKTVGAVRMDVRRRSRGPAVSHA
jgi:Mg/Co/Ni transporter MgtE